MADETYASRTHTYTITVYPGPADGKKYPAILLLHGNGGFRAPLRITASVAASMGLIV